MKTIPVPVREDPPKPAWIRARMPSGAGFAEVRALMRAKKLHTVCEEASCPNIGECWSRRSATFMILGSICTRACRFCDVATGKPLPPDPEEPERVAEAAAAMGLKHVVITSVDRDDLPDGGAAHFAATIRAVRKRLPQATIEVLTPDFYRKPDTALAAVIEARPDVFNHNVETVPRLYRTIRPSSRYYASLKLLDRAKDLDGSIVTKSGLMVGLGETMEEVLQVMDDLRAARVDMLTIGQYLRPSRKHHPVVRYWTPEEFAELEKQARRKGFAAAAVGPLVRSSFHAEDVYRALVRARCGA